MRCISPIGQSTPCRFLIAAHLLHFLGRPESELSWETRISIFLGDQNQNQKFSQTQDKKQNVLFLRASRSLTSEDLFRLLDCFCELHLVSDASERIASGLKVIVFYCCYTCVRTDCSLVWRLLLGGTGVRQQDRRIACREGWCWKSSQKCLSLKYGCNSSGIP